MRRQPTRAEREFEKFLLSLNEGILAGKFEKQYIPSGKWIIDFFFPEIRLGIEIDGGYHRISRQISRDRQKEKDCERFDITLLRITNKDVFGNRVRLIGKLRDGWKNALRRKNKIIGTTQ